MSVSPFMATVTVRLYLINVWKAYGGILKLVMSEYDMAVYNSLIVDSLLFGGTVYASKYIEPGSQSPAEAFYPISPNVLQASLRDPNITQKIDYQSILKQRKRQINPRLYRRGFI